MAKKSAGLVIYRMHQGQREFFLVHPGGPFWAKKDEGAWSIPKGEFDDHEEPLAVACREFTEETGYNAPGPFEPLGTVKMASGKVIHAFATVLFELDPTKIQSNTFEMEWPPRSGHKVSFPEVDRADWFNEPAALAKIHPAQAALLLRLPAR